MDAKNASRRLPFFITFIFFLALSACGGGGETTAPPKSTAPSFTSASITTNEDTESDGVDPKVIDPSANDSHTFSINIQPSHGVASIVSNQLVYMPETEYSGNDSFSFTATDNQGQSVTGNATVTVTSINDAPVSTSASISTNQGISGGITPTVVDIDPGDTHTFTVTIQGTKGIASVVDNQLVYMPDNATFGDDSFTYIATDSGGLSVTGTAAVNVIRDAPDSSILALAFGVKQLQFSWPVNSTATHFKLMENPDGVSTFTQLGADITDNFVNINISVFLHDWTNARYFLKACNQSGCVDSNQVVTSSDMLTAIGHLKASNKQSSDEFGSTVSFSNDGNTLAVSAVREDSNTLVINGDETDNNATDSGAVYIYVYDGSVWSQQAYIKASNTGAGDFFGKALHLSSDGNTLAVGAFSESSSAKGINGPQNNDDALFSGAVYIYTRSGSTWSQQAYLKGTNTNTQDRFGSAVKLSDDGNTLAVGAQHEGTTTSGINNLPVESVDSFKGAVYVFTRDANTWSEQAYIKASNNNTTLYAGHFGEAISLSSDGNTLAVGDHMEDSSTKGINGPGNNDDSVMSGAVYVFTRTNTTWTQQAYIKSSNSDIRDEFGTSVSLSSDGNTLAVGAVYEDSFSKEINTNLEDDNASNAGAAYVFTRQSTTWTQQAYIKASNTQTSMSFGHSITLSADGNRLAVGTEWESSNATGVNGNQNDTSKAFAGAVYVFDRTNSAWSQTAYVKAKISTNYLYFGTSVSFNADGKSLAAGAYGGGEGSVFLY